MVPFAWGYCLVKEVKPTDPPYYGRGPIQLTHMYNYQQAGDALNLDLVNNPDLVSSDPVVAFRTAIWFWMTAQSPKPSCHAVITNQWTPSDDDRSLGRVPGYGMATNIINGKLECGKVNPTDGDNDRVGFYKRYCDMLQIGPGENLDCSNQMYYGN
uniref:chitinase n=1 Tax=Leersia perrieri TaxID=77586 RepID=A0A0D9VP73_9ORYZ